ncbi:hypothetical protein DFH29DRAFT_1005107 [Suillus ampliporus]|nr:hypothetical protein DFH29DRAFT_1005107 [Suillus ampliporus]
MDLDESSVSQVSLDDLYLGPDDDIEYDSVSSGPLDVLAAIPTLPINPDLYLGPEDDLIDVDELPDSADAETDAPAPPEVSMSLDETSAKLHAERPELTNKYLYSMVQDFRPFRSFKHTGLQSIKDQLVITNAVIEIFLTLPSHNYSRPSDHSKRLGQKLLTNSKKLMQTCRGCKELNG